MVGGVMGTSVQVSTTTYSFTHVATNMLRSIKQIVIGCGLDPGHLADEWDVLELGVSAWLQSRHLKALVLEVYNRSTDAPVGRFDFTIDYGYYPNGDGDLWLDPDTISFAIRRAGLYPSGCAYGFIASTSPGRPAVSGWTSASFRSTDGMVRQSLGTALGGGSIGAGIDYWRKS
jgi:hypothetical protein